ncbi:MAG: hypothetical protein ACI9VR_001857 [Cognaticolwellia sp.]
MLKARPQALKRATEALPPKKARLRKLKAGVTAFRAQLLSKPVDALTRVRLRPKALEALPLLATEHRNPELRERVLALTLQYAKELRWPTLGRLLPWVINEKEVRRVVHERCSERCPKVASPGGHAPPWIQRHWRAALAKNHYLNRTLDVALEEQPILAQLLSGLGLRGASPFATALLERAVGRHSPAQLLAQPWTATLRFIEQDGAPWSGRKAILLGILQGLPPAPEKRTDQAPWMELSGLAVQRLGHPSARPGAWRTLPADTREKIVQIHRVAAPLRAFPPGDPRAWMWIRLGAQSADRVGPVVVLTLGDWICAERASSPAAVRVWSSTKGDALRTGLDQGKKATELPTIHARVEAGKGLEQAMTQLLLRT